ncbi:MAG: hypothetical protein ACRDNS_16035, partial [Trebonia sp.]
LWLVALAAALLAFGPDSDRHYGLRPVDGRPVDGRPRGGSPSAAGWERGASGEDGDLGCWS